MKLQKWVVLTLPVLMLTGNFAFAGKVESVQEEVKKTCGKDLPQDEALRLVKDLYLSCSGDDKVDVGGCKVKCLKEGEALLKK